IHRQGELTVAISTAGRAPALAVRLRDRIAAVIGPEYAELLGMLAEVREQIATRVPDFEARRRLWYRIVDSDALALARVADLPGHGPRQQDAINRLLIAEARCHRVVVRLKGGDPFVFGRGAEECEALYQAGVPFEVIPGVTAAVSVPAAAGIPVTHRRLASAFAVVAGHECEGDSDLDWEALARMPALVVLMGLRSLSRVTSRLMAAGA